MQLVNTSLWPLLCDQPVWTVWLLEAQGPRESERERKGLGKEKGRGREGLADIEKKIVNAPAGNQTTEVPL